MGWDLWPAFLGASIAISVSAGAGAIQSMATMAGLFVLAAVALSLVRRGAAT